jgi:hypothetical protein
VCKIPAAAMGIGAMCTDMLNLPLTSTMLLGARRASGTRAARDVARKHAGDRHEIEPVAGPALASS